MATHYRRIIQRPWEGDTDVSEGGRRGEYSKWYYGFERRQTTLAAGRVLRHEKPRQIVLRRFSRTVLIRAVSTHTMALWTECRRGRKMDHRIFFQHESFP